MSCKCDVIFQHAGNPLNVNIIIQYYFTRYDENRAKYNLSDTTTHSLQYYIGTIRFEHVCIIYLSHTCTRCLTEYIINYNNVLLMLLVITYYVWILLYMENVDSLLCRYTIALLSVLITVPIEPFLRVSYDISCGLSESLFGNCSCSEYV